MMFIQIRGVRIAFNRHSKSMSVRIKVPSKSVTMVFKYLYHFVYDYCNQCRMYSITVESAADRPMKDEITGGFALRDFLCSKLCMLTDVPTMAWARRPHFLCNEYCLIFTDQRGQGSNRMVSLYVSKYQPIHICLRILSIHIDLSEFERTQKSIGKMSSVQAPMPIELSIASGVVASITNAT